MPSSSELSLSLEFSSLDKSSLSIDIKIFLLNLSILLDLENFCFFSFLNFFFLFSSSSEFSSFFLLLQLAAKCPIPPHLKQTKGNVPLYFSFPFFKPLEIYAINSFLSSSESSSSTSDNFNFSTDWNTTSLLDGVVLGISILISYATIVLCSSSRLTVLRSLSSNTETFGL